MEDTLSGARVLIVGVNYAPETTGIAPYTTAIARDLAARGAQVGIVTGVPHYPGWKVAEGYRKTMLRREEDCGVHVFRARHYVPGRQDAVRRALFEVSWMPGAALQAVKVPSDVVLAISPSLAAMPLARGVAGLRRAPWAVVVQDLMGNAAARSGVPGGGRVSSLVSALESSHLRSADLVGVIGEGFADAVGRMGIASDRVRLLPNWTHVRCAEVDRAEARRRLGWRQQGFSVVHTGNMGAKQGLENVVAAAALAQRRDLDLEFVLVGDGSQRESLEASAAGSGRLRFVPPVSEENYPLVLAAADALLVNERPGMVEMSLPSKLTSYLAAGRPLIAAVPDSGWTASVLDESGAALRVAPADPAGLVNSAVRLSRDPALGDTLSRRGGEYREQRYGENAGLEGYAELIRELLALRRTRRAGSVTAHMLSTQ